MAGAEIYFWWVRTEKFIFSPFAGSAVVIAEFCSLFHCCNMTELKPGSQCGDLDRTPTFILLQPFRTNMFRCILDLKAGRRLKEFYKNQAKQRKGPEEGDEETELCWIFPMV